MAGTMLVMEAPTRADGGECVAASEGGLAARDHGHLRDAKKSFVVCAADTCPKPLRIDCARWLDEVEASIPTVVFGAKDRSGADVFDVKVSVDGEHVLGTEQGKAVALDPGPHVVRFERASSKPFETKILLRTGEHNRPILATLEDKPREEVGTKPLGPSSSERSPTEQVPTATWILGGVGLAGIGSFALFGILGMNEKSDLTQRCGQQCTDAEILGLKTKYVVADVSLGIGLVALGLATYFWLTAPKTSTVSRVSR
jgi:hypothetical protein